MFKSYETELEENLNKLQQLKNKVESLGESL